MKTTAILTLCSLIFGVANAQVTIGCDIPGECVQSPGVAMSILNDSPADCLELCLVGPLAIYPIDIVIFFVRF